MKVLIFGGNGMLGHKLVQVLESRFETWSTIRSSYSDVERFGFFPKDRTLENVRVEDLSRIEKLLEEIEPDIVINGIGVIKQKPNVDDVIGTLSINALFPQHLARIADQSGFRFITVGTDCVFKGDKGMYTENDSIDALDLYGQSKHWGEVSGTNSLTLRTSIIGRELTTQQSLIEWFLSQRGRTVKGYSKAIYSGFPTIEFADIIVDIIENHQDLAGVFNVSSEPISKFTLLEKLKENLKLETEIVDSTEVVIDRSLDSTKFSLAAGFKPKSWDEMIERLAEDCQSYNKWNNQGY